MNSKIDRFKLSPETKKTQADKVLAEYRAKEEAVNKNTERLRALRLAYEAQNPPATKEKATKAKRASKTKPESLSSFLKRESDSGRGT